MITRLITNFKTPSPVGEHGPKEECPLAFRAAERGAIYDCDGGQKGWGGVFLLLILFFCLPLAAQKSPDAKKVLDATAKRISNGGGIEAAFTMSNSVGSQQSAAGKGTILLEGKKFKVVTGDQTSWFDGKTLWTYNADIEEANVTTPTRKEQQAMNPYAFVSLYKQGYNYTVKQVTTSGKQAYEVHLTAEKPKQDIPEIFITIDKSYAPLSIRMKQGGSWATISITRFQTGRKIAAGTFTFPKEKYPDAEVIDMR